ncbi:MAG: DUF726 domain-containing protein, partial [Desulfobacterales bacterium]|nr:DUF726 domain-containing protein [Desulfobacterales bacterium]
LLKHGVVKNYKLTLHSLKGLKKDNVPEEIITKLNDLELIDKHIVGEDDFLNKVKETIGEGEEYVVLYKDQILKHGFFELGDYDFLEIIKKNWGSELCAEHNGSIADFEKLNLRLNDLANYEQLFERSKWNWAKGAAITGCMIVSSAVFGPLAYLAAPGIASALGAAGLLGTATTGTAISSLHGIALTTASLYALGPGGVAGGIAFVSATGVALGAAQGAVISNNYFGEINNFKITKVRDGKGPALIFINGFLSQKNQDASDWIKSVSKRFSANPYYYVNWESSNLYEMGRLIVTSVGGMAFKRVIIDLMVSGNKIFPKLFNTLNWALFASWLISNPWHTSMVKAAMTGILLADLIARTDYPDGFILIGHSLGARVIYYLLNALSTKEKSQIQDVYLLGGAVDRNDNEGWEKSLKAVNGKLYNCYSENDDILRFLYTVANLFQSSPIGLGPIIAGFKLTQNSLEKLKADGLSEKVLEKLKSLLDQDFTKEIEFADQVKKTIKDNDEDNPLYDQYKERILNHAKIIKIDDKLINMDVTSIVDSHMAYKEKFSEILDKIEYEISEIVNGQYTVTINLERFLSRSNIEQIKGKLDNIVKTDPFINDLNGHPIIRINKNALSYTSESIFPNNLDSKKEKILLVFGNPATHSIRYGMFLFSKANLARHNIWKKLHDAKLIRFVDYSKLNNLSQMEIREAEANERRKMILDGETSEKYLVGLTTFYSFPTPVVEKYKYSNVTGVVNFFDSMIDSINAIETKRILNYPFSENATLVFIQKSSFDIFKKSVSLLTHVKYKEIIYWPAVSREKGVKSSGKDLLDILESK